MAGSTSAKRSATARAGELSVLAVVHEREKERKGKLAQLTAVLMERTAWSGTSCCGGYGGSAATVASAMAWEREGEELGANGGVQGGRGATWSSSPTCSRPSSGHLSVSIALTTSRRV